MEDVSQDSLFLTHLDPTDRQNMRIAFNTLLGQKLLKHITTNFDVYKAFNDNPEFKTFFGDRMFDMVVQTFRNLKIN